MTKQISFYIDVNYVPGSVRDRDKLCTDWHSTELAIFRGDELIHTTQMGMLDTVLFLRGYQMFVTDEDGTYEIKIGEKNTRTGMELKYDHNLFRLWRNGEFHLK